LTLIVGTIEDTTICRGRADSSPTYGGINEFCNNLN